MPLRRRIIGHPVGARLRRYTPRDPRRDARRQAQASSRGRLCSDGYAGGQATPIETGQNDNSSRNTGRARATIGRRVVVVGSPCSGKSTLAARLAPALDAPQVELDAIHWGPNWTERPHEEMRHEVRAAVAGDAWVADGNYPQVRDLVWPRAETLVWLDYGMATIYRRLLARTWRRWRCGEELWSGNLERLRMHLQWDGLPIWVLRTYRRRGREYRRLLAPADYSHLRVVRQCGPGETERWLRELETAALAVSDERWR